MQAEMIREIEASAPEFIVYTDSALSWGNKPGPNLRISAWWKSYQTNYTLVGLTGVFSSTNSLGGADMDFGAPSGQTNFSALAVFQRRTGDSSLVEQLDKP